MNTLIVLFQSDFFSLLLVLHFLSKSSGNGNVKQDKEMREKNKTISMSRENAHFDICFQLPPAFFFFFLFLFFSYFTYLTNPVATYMRNKKQRREREREKADNLNDEGKRTIYFLFYYLPLFPSLSPPSFSPHFKSSGNVNHKQEKRRRQRKWETRKREERSE